MIMRFGFAAYRTRNGSPESWNVLLISLDTLGSHFVPYINCIWSTLNRKNEFSLRG